MLTKPTEKPDHVLDMFMSGVMATLIVAVLSAVAHKPEMFGMGGLIGAFGVGLSLLLLDGLMFADSFLCWRFERIDSEDWPE